MTKDKLKEGRDLEKKIENLESLLLGLDLAIDDKASGRNFRISLKISEVGYPPTYEIDLSLLESNETLQLVKKVKGKLLEQIKDFRIKFEEL